MAEPAEWPGEEETTTAYNPDALARKYADDAVASLCGLVLRRLQEDRPSRDPERNLIDEIIDARLSEIFGEALQQFTQDR